MSTFWKPQPNVGQRTQTTPYTKVLGNAVYVLWCRCDLCFSSGPSTLFVLLARGSETGELCGFCAGHEQTMSDLRADGWSVRD